MHHLDFPLRLRALHFCNLLFITLLIRSGLEILGAHPKLYWNDNCVPGSEWLNFGEGIPLPGNYRSMGQGQGGWREDFQFYSREAGI